MDIDDVPILGLWSSFHPVTECEDCLSALMSVQQSCECQAKAPRYLLRLLLQQLYEDSHMSCFEVMVEVNLIHICSRYSIWIQRTL